MIKQIFKNEFERGAIILFICINVFNFLNLIFNFFCGRMLGPTGYGILATLMSFVSIYGIPSEVIQNIVSKYTTKFKGESSKLSYVFKIFFKNSIFLAGGLFVILALISIPLSKRLEINYWLMILTHLLIFTTFLSPIPRGVIQGKKKFAQLGTPNLVEGIVKLGFAILLIYLGFNVFGAIYAVLISAIVSMLIYFYFSRELIRDKEEKTKLDGVKFGPYFVLMWTLIVFLSLDIILAKWFLSPETAGKYAAISMIGKVIYLGTSSITKVLFPMASEKHENKEETKSILKKSMIITFFIGIVGVLIYLAFPELIVTILYGREYIEISKYIFYSGIAFLILAMTNINFIYCLSTNRTKNYLVMVLGILVQISLFYFMHSSLEMFVFTLVLSNIVMFILSFLLFRK